jgi:hypothetical protein
VPARAPGASARAAAWLFQRSDLRYLLIASRGSSSNVARCAQYLLGRAHRVPVVFATPSLYTIYGQPPRLDVAPSGPARPSVEEIVPPLRARGARLVAASDVRAVLRRAQTKLVLAPGVPEWLSPLTAVVPGQVAAMRLTRLAASTSTGLLGSAR